MGKIKYFGAYVIPLLGLYTFNTTGIYAYLGLFLIYIIIPIIEHVLPQNTYNLNKVEKELARKDLFFDLLLYLIVFLHLFIVYTFLVHISDPNLSLLDLIASVLMMGTILGVNGINVGHELGHKTDKPFKMFLAHIILTTSMQNHFIPYHNGGHHRDVATPEDLSSAKVGDNFYFFGLKSQIGGYFKTWKLEAQRLKFENKNTYWNPMIIYTMLPITLLLVIYLFFGFNTMLIYFITGVLGISILEAQNYFSHYGLRRKMQENGRYEKVKRHHSWNSDHIIGRVLLFELTRHSDHHHMGAKPFQMLENKNDSPVLPYGYPMMLMLCYFPFIFRPLMKKHLKLYGIE